MVLNKLLQMQELGTETSLSSELIHAVIAQMKQWRSDRDEIFLLDADAVPSTSDAWPVVTFNVELVTFMAEVISRSSSVLSSDEWDFIMCSLVAWFQTVQSASLSLLHTPCVMALITAVASLLRCTAVCIENVVPQRLDDYPASLISEWQDVFSPSAFEMALPLFVNLASAATHSSSLMVIVMILFLLQCSISVFRVSPIVVLLVYFFCFSIKVFIDFMLLVDST